MDYLKDDTILRAQREARDSGFPRYVGYDDQFIWGIFHVQPALRYTHFKAKADATLWVHIYERGMTDYKYEEINMDGLRLENKEPPEGSSELVPDAAREAAFEGLI